MKKIGLLIFILINSFLSIAQTNIAKDNPLEIEPGSNLLFVPILVMCILIIGVYIYLFSMDKKIKNLEKNSLK